MTDQKPEKKVVSRTVAITLGIICIVLAVGLVGVIADLSLQISSLNSKVNDLDSIVNFQKQETWFSNDTLTINPNENVSEQFTAPLSGNAKVVGNVQPSISGIWTNLTCWVVYDWLSDYPSPYHISPIPHIDAWYSNYFEEQFPIISFAPFEPIINPNIQFVIGNNGTQPVTVNLTITFTY